MHARRVEPHEEGFAVGLRLVHELEGQIANFIVYSLHPLGIESSGVFDPLLADLAPARHLGGIIRGGGPAVHHVAWTDCIE